MNLYELKNIDKIYGKSLENHALNHINLIIQEKEMVVILGPSGSGKSTLLNILSGIDKPTNGTILFQNIKLNQLNKEELTDYRRDYLGFIFQSYHLIPNLTVEENVELGAHLSKNPLDIDEIIEAVGLKEQKQKYPYQLSGGQMQRVAIARSLVKNPKVLFCDEPTGALDEKTGKKVLKLLQNLNQKYHTTIIIVTHNPSIALMANTVITMNSGKIVKVQKNKTMLDAEELRWA